MKKQKTAPAESAVQTEKKGTGIQIDKKTVFGITALLLVIMLLAGVLTQVVPRGEYQMDDSGMVINGTYHEFAGDEGKMPWWKIILAPIMVFTSSQITTGIGIVVFIVLVGSGTAKAFLIMPIVLPLADLLGLTRQSIVLAFTMGDGFCNILYPTSGIMVIAIGMVGISYGKYLRWSWKLFVMEFALAALAMLGAVAIGY